MSAQVCRKSNSKVDYKIIYESLPLSVKGFTMHEQPKNFYTIVLNKKYDRETLKKTLKHEMGHILRNDFDSPLSVDEIETIAHALDN